MNTFFLSKKGNIILLRWLMILVLSYLVAFGGGTMGFGFKAGFLSLLILSNLFLSFVSGKKFQEWRLEYAIVVLDTLLISSMIFLSRDFDLYLVFFLTLLTAALGRDLRWSFLISSVSVLLYVILFLKSRSLLDLWEPSNLIRLPLLYVISVFASFLAAGSHQEESYREKTEHLMRLSQDLNSTIDPGKICDCLLAFLSETKMTTYAAILFYKESSSQPFLERRYPFRENLENQRFALAELPADMKEALFQEKKPFHCPHFDGKGAPSGLVANGGKRLGSLLILPCVVKGKTIVLLVLGNEKYQAFPPEAIQDLVLICGQFASALENARLFTNLGQNAIELNTLINVSKLIGSSLNLKEVLAEAMDQVKKVMGVEACSLLMLEEESGELVFEVALGERGEEVKEFRLKKGEGIAGRVAQEGKPVMVSDAQNDPRFFSQVDEKAHFVTRSLIAAPLLYKGKVIGVAEAINKIGEDGFNEREFELFTVLCHQMAMALENARLYEKMVELFGRISQEKSKMEAILEGMVEGVVVLDQESHIFLFNQRAKELFQIAKVTPDGGVIAENRAWDHFQRVLQGTLSRGLPLNEKIILEEGAEERVFYAKMAPIRDKANSIVGALGVLEDITEMERVNQLKSEFVSHVSHELRTPLTSIKGAAGLLRRPQIGELNPKQARLIQILDAESSHLADLIDDLLVLAKLEAKKVEMKRELEDLAEIVAACTESLKTVAEQKGLKIEQMAPPSLPRILVDRTQIQKVFYNLLGNAIKFTPAGGEITVVIRPVYNDLPDAQSPASLNHIEVDVNDTGIGIPKPDLSRIFEKFHRVDSALTAGIPGTGLGLSICREIIKAHGGRIWVESEVGKGSQFHFALPPG